MNIISSKDNEVIKNIRKLKEQVILDRTTLEKRVSGGQKAYMTKRIDDLEKQIG